MTAPELAAEVVFVCTGNICRSPMARYAFAARMQEYGCDVTTASMGTDAVWGQEMHPWTQSFLRTSHGIEMPHASAPLDRELLRASGLVLTMTQKNRADVVRTAPAVVRRAFTLREAVTLCTAGSAPGEGPGLPGLVQELTRRRGAVALDAEGLDVADPFGASWSVHEKVYEEIDGLVDVFAKYVACGGVAA